MRRARWSSCAAPTIRRRAAATRRTGARCRRRIHWVSAAHAVPAEVRLYNPLFAKPDPDAGDFAADLNPNSLEVLADARARAGAGRRQRRASPCSSSARATSAATADSKPGRPVFNRTVGLRDTWAKVSGGGKG